MPSTVTELAPDPGLRPLRDVMPEALRRLADAALDRGATGPAMVERAGRLLGRSYQHMGNGPDGFDSWGLVRAVVADVTGATDLPNPLRMGWGVSSVAEAQHILLNMGLRQTDVVLPGDVLAFLIDGRVHVGVLSSAAGEGRVIHAYFGHSVVESWLGPFWAERRIGAFTLPAAAVQSARAAA